MDSIKIFRQATESLTLESDGDGFFIIVNLTDYAGDSITDYAALKPGMTRNDLETFANAILEYSSDQRGLSLPPLHPQRFAVPDTRVRNAFKSHDQQVEARTPRLLVEVRAWHTEIKNMR
jgi:hypothetical protein